MGSLGGRRERCARATNFCALLLSQTALFFFSFSSFFSASSISASSSFPLSSSASSSEGRIFVGLLAEVASRPVARVMT